MTVTLALNVWLEPYLFPIGELGVTDRGDTYFRYTSEYLATSTQIPISLSMPITEAIYTDIVTRAFFQNLLQENNQLDDAIDRYSIASGDFVTLLYYLGADCSGAISCLPMDAGPQKTPGSLIEDYDPLSNDTLLQIVQALSARTALPGELNDPSPLAGVQRKISVAHTRETGFLLPKPGRKVPTTHIIKVPKQTERRDVKLEAATLSLAQTVGLNTAYVEAREIGDIPYLLIERFDRQISSEGLVTRLHQEDFLQASGLPASLKYERKGTDRPAFSAAVAANIVSQLGGGVRTREQFLLLTFFNLLVGNTDNHGKNHAVIHRAGRAPILAPAYDLLPVLLQKNITHDLAFAIGSATHPEEVTVDDIFELLALFGFRGKGASRFVTTRLNTMMAALELACTPLCSQLLKDMDDVIGARLSELNECLSLDVKIRERDFLPIEEPTGSWVAQQKA